MKFYIILPIFATIAAAQQQQYTTPIPILKQINKHNEDGSYSYGYEAADGSFKIESKYPNGEVYGKYGYVDDQGKLRQIEYGASRRGFEPAGNEITVPPPTLVSNYPVKALAPNEEDDGQYREDPGVYYKDDKYNQQASFTPRYTQTYQPDYQGIQSGSSRYQQEQQPASYQQPNNYQQQSYQQPTSFQPSSSFQKPSSFQQPFSFQQPSNVQQPSSFQPTNYQPSFRPQTSFSSFSQPQTYHPSPPAFPNYNQFAGSPATNVDISSGSYSVNYK